MYKGVRLMSYDIRFKVKVEGIDRYVNIGCDANITWNARKIIEESTGLEWNNEANNGLCTEAIPKIAVGFCELVNSPEKYKQYEAKNGWGTVEGTKYFFKQILEQWDELVLSDPEIASIATFWIE